MAGNLIERAYEIARSGRARSILEIKMQLNMEGFSYVDQHLDGAAIRTTLRNLMAARDAEPPAPAASKSPDVLGE